MLTVKDIIRKEISAADPSASCVWDSGIDDTRAAWVHPGGLYTLLLTKEETEEFKLDMYQPVYHAEWIKAAWEYSRLQENFNSFSSFWVVKSANYGLICRAKEVTQYRSFHLQKTAGVMANGIITLLLTRYIPALRCDTVMFTRE